jgi:hypothetical protein
MAFQGDLTNFLLTPPQEQQAPAKELPVEILVQAAVQVAVDVLPSSSRP